MTVALAEALGHRVERDSHGNPQLSGSGALGDFLADYLKANMKVPLKALRVRADTFGYLQRSFAGYASEVDRSEARQCGRKAAEFAMSGDLDEGRSLFAQRIDARVRESRDFLTEELLRVAEMRRLQ